ncbi:AbrB/MazE/SpoVT family DNA-binding domain-containing protein [Candidatus Uhrbacteria bacterium]|nr:AbrB/MazE/SpoVT family DNA-binding domain-containing protein [Candidatus Uhrbacteria bacterium]
MQPGYITQPNTKGQVVIPKELRERFVITDRSSVNIIPYEDGLYLHPIHSVFSKGPAASAYQKTLLKTKGSWGAIDEKHERAHRARELSAARKRRASSW